MNISLIRLRSANKAKTKKLHTFSLNFALKCTLSDGIIYTGQWANAFSGVKFTYGNNFATYIYFLYQSHTVLNDKGNLELQVKKSPIFVL